MKRILSVVFLLMFTTFVFAAGPYPNKEFGEDLGKDGRSYGDLYLKNKIVFEGATSNAYEGSIAVPDVGADYTWTFPAKTGTIAMTSDVSSAASAWDDLTSPDANKTHAFTTFTSIFTGTSTAADQWNFQGLGAFGDVSVMRIEQKTGNPTDGTVLEVVSADTDVDALVVTANGVNPLVVTGAGAVNVVGALSQITGVASFNASSNYATNINTGTSTGTVSIGGGSNSVGISTSTWDISTAGVVSGVTGLSMSGDISLADGNAVKSSTTTAETMKLQAYDVDGATYRDALTLTNGNTVAIALGSNNETVAIDSSDWNIGATGDMTGIGALTMDGLLTYNNAAMTLYANEALTITHASNGAADDLIFAQTGANDASILLQSAGTGADAIGLAASAGSVDIDAAAAKDVTIDGGQVLIASKDNAASAIALTANQGASETIVVTNTQGTSEAAITLTSTAGGVDIDGAAAKDANISAGQVALVSKDDAASAISLTANVGTSETIVLTNTKGTAAGAITATATAGGVDIDAAATKDVDISGGQVLLSSKDNAASAVAITTNVGTSETIVVTNTQGTDAAAINLTATAGGITAATAAGKAITLNGTTNLKVGSNVASPAGGELDLGDGNYFYITGTNNITSIAAADATAGRMIVLRFADILTFTDGNNLKLAGNMATTADDTITLMCDGTNCYEIARSAN